jgi:1,2-diacylglycerol 3-beta-galactosyltransferase
VTRLLFLIADTGGGHRASANAVSRHLHDAMPGDFDVRIVDPFADVSPRMVARTAGLYGPITRHAAWSWGALYHLTNSRVAVAALHRTVLRSVQKGVQGLLAGFDPDAVVSFHPLLNHVAVEAVHESARRVPVMTVITDLVDVHAAWASADVDAVVIPSPGGLDRCRRAGIPARRCYDLGLPVDPAFTAALPTPAERVRLRERLGLDAGRFVVLVCGGADGSGGIARRARALAAAALDVQLVVICGRNRRALKNLAGLRDWRGNPVAVHGFVRNMAEWMRAADVVATKAGPGTIAEALCCGVPLLLTCYIPGQERGNVEWVSDIGAGRFVPRLHQLVDTVAELAEPDSTALAGMRAVVQRVARPDATARIAELIASMAAGERRVPLPRVARG